MSLAVVCANALSGSVAYARMGRVDYQTGLVFAAATVPGAIGGVFATDLFSRGPFDLMLGVLLVVMAVWLTVRPTPETQQVTVPNAYTRRTLVDADGVTYRYAYSRPLGLALSGVVGFLSSLLGIGGGIIHVPAMVELLHIPPHVATATSHFILLLTSLTGTVVHTARGDFHNMVGATILLGIGVTVGAQVGARLSTHLQGPRLVRLLAVALALVGGRFIFGAI